MIISSFPELLLNLVKNIGMERGGGWIVFYLPAPDNWQWWFRALCWEGFWAALTSVGVLWSIIGIYLGPGIGGMSHMRFLCLWASHSKYLKPRDHIWHFLFLMIYLCVATVVIAFYIPSESLVELCTRVPNKYCNNAIKNTLKRVPGILKLVLSRSRMVPTPRKYPQSDL